MSAPTTPPGSHRHLRSLPPRAEFVARVALHAAIGGSIIVVSLGIGVVGYHAFAGLPWIDSLLNAAMILTGMGPVDPVTTTGAKLFATVYALFSGVAFLGVAAVLIAPVAHRFLHRLHVDMAEEETGASETHRLDASGRRHVDESARDGA